ncbi:hypothetical protein GLOIN_2v1845389 [Rhizophagus irregularis DAOM 181602=DAOM 197198]|uniref:BED-type domain-containing protein n=1 Tax=Rhizophagus irregularis (strain DAOM 181602 / DAOM 197198 / MUCL 43194) TaxID=747089 RepID=A0A2P4PG10_RHIID|nr:hypothetical protein GLOIN_2v1845389 [Rhizophagus irregularis DAOM 181602=DAOM 197198]POG64290.1 hypothetical protein GLOIN_2v1845389 [Rhizophagus irregularis DAOM 181602=DAOM 197198]|eukprot:XP_025171156.1 hypothetical protein GLOIN_2v1845389 [Rhizophagus irregularis DAOM 181602=DAOM 197198]
MANNFDAMDTFLEPLDLENELDDIEPKHFEPKKPGKKKNGVWNYFIEEESRKGGHLACVCIYCGDAWNRGRIPDMMAHLALQLKNLCAGYQLPDRKTLSNTWLNNKAVRVTVNMEEILERQENLSLVITSERKEYVIKVKDYSKDSHTGLFTAQEIKKILTDIGSQRFSSMLIDNSKAMNQSLRILVNNRNFWSNVEALANILEPAKNAVKSVECKNTTMADVFFALIQMAISIKALPTETSEELKEFRQKCIQFYNYRWKQFDFELYLLAYFLHSKYRGKGLIPETY